MIRRVQGPLRLGIGAFACAVLAAAVAGAPASASPGVVKRVSQAPNAVTDYWTDARMAAARPAEELLQGVLPAVEPVPGESGPAVTVAPVGRRGLLDDLLKDLLGGGAQQARSAVEVPNHDKRPVRAHGRVFFRLAGGNYYCSATVVKSKIRRLVVTAGHCAHDFGQFAENWMFVPAYKQGAEPFGRWTAKRIAVPKRWKVTTSNGNPADDDLRYDVAMVTLRSRKGKRIQEVVGARGIGFNKARDRTYQAFGYPAVSPFDGERPYMCVSPFRGTDEEFAPPRPLRIDCDMTAGASGGGMVVGGRTLVSVISYSYGCEEGLPIIGDLLPCSNPEAGKLFGPYFGNSIRKLYKRESRPKRK
ncbi:MAG TPA: trypsin-like serine protease [Solirubrobacterales bacterium]